MRDFSYPGKSLAVAERGMIATSHPAASIVGLEILKQGGSAVDAGIAAIFTLCVVEPAMVGIGGDCFALYGRPGQEPIALNGSGWAPEAASPEWYANQGIKEVGQNSVHAVTVPGLVGGLFKLHQDHGKLEWEKLLQPAIRAARDGYLITPRVALDWGRFESNLKKDPDAASQFLVSGKAPNVGDRVRNPALASTLEAIAKGGPSKFYHGTIAEKIVAKLESIGGLHTVADFEGYSPDYVAPISTDYADQSVYECPPNGQGIIALMIMNILKRRRFKDLAPDERVHFLTEATKRAYAARDEVLCDPSHTEVDTDYLLSGDWADKAYRMIGEKAGVPGTRMEEVAHQDTVYLCVVDDDQNALSLIGSLFSGFGSCIAVPDTGIMLHNRGWSFRLNPTHPNVIGPKKRPMHTIIPGLTVKNSKPVMPFGVMGGHYQATGHAALLANIYDLGMDVQEASDAPRSFYAEGKLTIERTLGKDIAEKLEKRGHVLDWQQHPIGGCQAIQIDHDRGILIGASDCRKDGFAVGH